MITVERRVGQLVEARFDGAITVAMLKEFSTNLAQIIVKAGMRLVFVVDFRNLAPFDSTIEAMLLGQMRSDNFAIERSSFLLRPGTPVCTEMERLAKLAKNPARRTFTTLDDLMGWVGPVLKPDEVKRAIDFMAERS
ncbi:MAG: hypothetical protein JST54_10425 [Deltaproteobacteria bacterium]|nr:hypothetical protein [Deltaproteobacteria bacterium]